MGSILSRRIFIVAKKTAEAEHAWKELTDRLTRRNLEVWVAQDAPGLVGDERLFDLDKLPPNGELVIVVGGDGTFLRTARAAVKQGIPLLGINLGTLGFLTEFDRDQIGTVVTAIENKTLSFEEREVLSVSASGFASREVVAANDAVLNKNALSRMVDLEIALDGRDSYIVRADGLIVSTPTGSTAYNLSAGGPIVVPDLRLVVLSPICPHGLGYRPLLVPSDRPITICVRDGDTMFLTVDGQVGCALQPQETVEIRRYPKTLHIVTSSDHNFFSVLRKKLGWGHPSYRSARSEHSK